MTTEEAIEKKFCPISGYECPKHRCMWWLKDGVCAIADIADSLGDLGYIADALEVIKNRRFGAE